MTTSGIKSIKKPTKTLPMKKPSTKSTVKPKDNSTEKPNVKRAVEKLKEKP